MAWRLATAAIWIGCLVGGCTQGLTRRGGGSPDVIKQDGNVKLELRGADDVPSGSFFVGVRRTDVSLPEVCSPLVVREDKSAFIRLDPGSYELDVFESPDGIRKTGNRSSLPVEVVVENNAHSSSPISIELKRWSSVLVRSANTSIQELRVFRMEPAQLMADARRVMQRAGGKLVGGPASKVEYRYLVPGQYYVAVAESRNGPPRGEFQFEVGEGEAREIVVDDSGIWCSYAATK